MPSKRSWIFSAAVVAFSMVMGDPSLSREISEILKTECRTGVVGNPTAGLPLAYPMVVRFRGQNLNVPYGYLRWPANQINCTHDPNRLFVSLWMPDGRPPAADTSTLGAGLDHWHPKESGRDQSRSEEYLLGVLFMSRQRASWDYGTMKRNIIERLGQIPAPTDNSMRVIAGAKSADGRQSVLDYFFYEDQNSNAILICGRHASDFGIPLCNVRAHLLHTDVALNTTIIRERLADTSSIIAKLRALLEAWMK
jgi:hypothetical protein